LRDSINVFYYPDFFADFATVMKSILLFDEVHFMDRPSMFFGGGQGQYGTVGADSPLRRMEASIRAEGVPFFVHPAPMGIVQGEWYEQIKSDANDPRFLKRFQEGLRVSSAFRELQISPGNYGPCGSEKDILVKVLSVDVDKDFLSHETPMTLFEDGSIRQFLLTNKSECAKQLVSEAVICSAKLNFALDLWAKEGFYPLADSKPYGDLLGAKYARAIDSLDAGRNQIQLTDLSFAIFDALISTERLRQLSLKDVIDYRKRAAVPREEFLQHLAVIQSKQRAIAADGDYAGAIKSLIDSEIRPAVSVFKNKMKTIDEALFGALAIEAIGAAAHYSATGSSGLNFYGDLSWLGIVALAGSAAGYAAIPTLVSVLAERAAKRDCSISYILALES
jgi:hypothetical protein